MTLTEPEAGAGLALHNYFGPNSGKLEACMSGDLLEDQTREALSEQHFFPAARGEQDLGLPHTELPRDPVKLLMLGTFAISVSSPARRALACNCHLQRGTQQAGEEGEK